MTLNGSLVFSSIASRYMLVMAPLTHLTLFFSMLAASALCQSDYAPSSVTVTHTVTHTLETCAGESSTAGTSYTTTTVTSTTEKTITIHKTRHSSSTSDGGITPFQPTITIKPTPKPSIVSIHNVTLTRASTLPAFKTCTDPACRPYQLPTPDMSHHSSSYHLSHSHPTGFEIPQSTGCHEISHVY